MQRCDFRCLHTRSRTERIAPHGHSVPTMESLLSTLPQSRQLPTTHICASSKVGCVILPRMLALTPYSFSAALGSLMFIKERKEGASCMFFAFVGVVRAIWCFSPNSISHIVFILGGAYVLCMYVLLHSTQSSVRRASFVCPSSSVTYL